MTKETETKEAGPTLSEKLQTQQAAQKVAVAQPTVLDMLHDRDGKFRTQLQRALPPGLRADRYLRVLLTEARQNPKLLECTQRSFISVVMDMAGLGLEPGPLGDVYIVPFRDGKRNVTEATLILGYRGMIRLARRSGEIASLTAEVVHVGDEFDYELGTNKRIFHKPLLLDEERETIAFYAVAEYVNGGKDFKVLSKKQVDSYRARSRAKDDGPWKTDYAAMGMKTAIRRLSPFLPLTQHAATMIKRDEERELGVTPEVTETADTIVPEEPAPQPEKKTSDAAD